MPPHEAVASEPESLPGQTLFSVRHANCALVLVRRITADIVARYRQLMELRAEAVELERGYTDDGAGAGSQEEAAVQGRIDRCVSQLHSLGRELEAIGCVLKDARVGLVDFPAVHEGRRIWLCWKLGEPEVAYWHEWNAGYSGRRPVTELMAMERPAAGGQPPK